MVAVLVCASAHAQVNSGSNGSDGAFNPTTSVVINMADHSDGIYQYASVNIPTNVTVTFIPHANNTPVVWLVQSNCVINGTVDVSGQTSSNSTAGLGGPGGWRGGNGGSIPASGQGPGGGIAGLAGGWASATAGPANYCNSFLIPLLGGSGGGAVTNGTGGGGGGGAILVAASYEVKLNGNVNASGGIGLYLNNVGIAGGGSGGAVRIVASRITGLGSVNAGPGYPGPWANGRIRFDTYENNFGGSVSGAFAQGSQFIIIPTNGQAAQLTITSVGGVPVSASPSGQLATPDAVLSAQQNNPIAVVVHCSNIPLNTQITVSVKPANVAAVSATGLNSSGTLSSSSATVLINMPRGGGLIYATAAN